MSHVQGPVPSSSARPKHAPPRRGRAVLRGAPCIIITTTIIITTIITIIIIITTIIIQFNYYVLRDASEKLVTRCAPALFQRTTFAICFLREIPPMGLSFQMKCYENAEYLNTTHMSFLFAQDFI